MVTGADQGDEYHHEKPAWLRPTANSPHWICIPSEHGRNNIGIMGNLNFGRTGIYSLSTAHSHAQWRWTTSDADGSGSGGREQLVQSLHTSPSRSPTCKTPGLYWASI